MAQKLLTLGAIVGVITTGYLAAKGTTKYEQLKAQERPITKIDEAETWIKSYYPAIISGAVTIFGISGLFKMSKKAQLYWMGLYSAAAASHNKYVSANRKLFGENAHKKILEEVELQKSNDVSIGFCGLASNYSTNISDILGKPVLCHDEYSNRWFEKTAYEVLEAQYHTNRNMALGAFVGLNDYYDFLGLGPRPEYADLGWMICDSMYYLDFSNTVKKRSDGTRYLCISFVYEPMTEQQYDEYYL